MDPGEKSASGGDDGDVDVNPKDSPAAVSAPETLLTPGQESVDTLDKGALSPLTGSYLLIVLAEPHSSEVSEWVCLVSVSFLNLNSFLQDREIIIKRLIKGW